MLLYSHFSISDLGMSLQLTILYAGELLHWEFRFHRGNVESVLGRMWRETDKL